MQSSVEILKHLLITMLLAVAIIMFINYPAQAAGAANDSQGRYLSVSQTDMQTNWERRQIEARQRQQRSIQTLDKKSIDEELQSRRQAADKRRADVFAGIRQKNT